MKSIAWIFSIALLAATMVNAESSWSKVHAKHRSHPHNGPNHCGKHVAGYFPSWNTKKYPLSNVDMTAYSDVYFFVALTTPTSALALDSAGNVTGRDVKAFVSAAKAGGSRPILAIGGWTGSVYFSPNVATASNRTAFAKSISKFYKKYNFDGIDLDWEYPSVQGIGCNIIAANDTSNLILLFKELRTMLPKASLSMAASMTGIKEGAAGTLAVDLSALSSIIDYVNVMAYDAWGSWSATTGPLAPFKDTCSNDGLSVKKAVQIFLNQKFKASQIVVGIPSYGRSWTTLNSTLVKTTVGSHTSLLYQAKSAVVPRGIDDIEKPGPDICGNAQAWTGVWPVSQLVEHEYLSSNLKKGSNGYKRYFDDCSATPFLFNKKTRHLISYDDAESSAKKAKYVKSMGLKGVFFYDTAGAVPKILSASLEAL